MPELTAYSKMAKGSRFMVATITAAGESGALPCSSDLRVEAVVDGLGGICLEAEPGAEEFIR